MLIEVSRKFLKYTDKHSCVGNTTLNQRQKKRKNTYVMFVFPDHDRGMTTVVSICLSHDVPTLTVITL